MIRRHWLLTLTFLSCAALVGCAGNPVRDPGPLPLFQLPPQDAIASAPAPETSPYHSLPQPQPMPKPPAPPAPLPEAVAPAPENPPIQPTAHRNREPSTPREPPALTEPVKTTTPEKK